MSSKTLKRSESVAEPAPPPDLEEPTGTIPTVLPPSTELGDQLQRLEQDQAEIDRRKAEELARLREIQDRD